MCLERGVYWQRGVHRRLLGESCAKTYVALCLDKVVNAQVVMGNLDNSRPGVST